METVKESEWIPYENDGNPSCKMLEQEAADANRKFINLNHILDIYINMEIRLPQGESVLFGKVIGACFDKNDKIIGTQNEIPFLYTVLYKVKFKDGPSQAYGANLIAKNIWRIFHDMR